MRPRNFDFNPRLFQYGGAYIYTMGAYFGSLHITGAIRLKNDIVYYLKNPDMMGRIFYFGRMLNIFLMLITIIFIFLASKELYDERAGLAACLIFAISPAVLFQVHLLKPYVFANMFTSICLYCSCRILKNPDKIKYVIFAGIAMGLVSGSMQVYSTMIIIPLLACVFGKNNIFAGIAHAFGQRGTR